MDLRDFWEELNRHDWYYNYSDDHRVWRRGNANIERLEAISATIEGGPEMLSGFRGHYFSGEPWGTTKAAKPSKPNAPLCKEDLAVWPDGTFCTLEDLEDFLQFKSDDYEVVLFNSPEARKLTS